MLGEPHAALRARYVTDATGATLGYVLQTSPEGDEAIGFSGPSNVLVGFDADDQIIGLRLLDSGDTREHAAMVARSPTFREGFHGASWDEASALEVDAVSGATLTSLAAAEAVVTRLSGKRPSLRFPSEPTVAEARRAFPGLADRIATVKLLEDGPYYNVVAENGESLGRLLRSTPAGDQIVGYQGPTEVWLLLEPQSAQIVKLGVGPTYDNETYVDYVREDDYFRSLFSELTIGELAALDLDEAQVEGVSGATMTSLAVAESAVAAARHEMRRATATETPRQASKFWSTWTWMDGVACGIIAWGVIIGLTRLRGRRRLVRMYQLGLIGFLGFAHGDLLSQAMLVGWSQHGVPWQRAPSLVLLTLAALTVPIVAGRNVYCSHLCAHGAAQQWLKHISPWRWPVPNTLAQALKFVPVLLLMWVVFVAVLRWPFSLVDIEPFDAWVFWVAGIPTLTIAIVGLVWSAFTPMAYCRYGCPTGALLGYTRKHTRSSQWGRRDWVAFTLLLLALALSFQS